MATVLDGAVRIFRERGYNATSIADLSLATGLAAGSIYKAFKDKRGLFLAAFDRYVEEGDALRRLAFQNGGNGRDKLKSLLGLYANASSGAEGMRGCLVAGSTIELATMDAGHCAAGEGCACPHRATACPDHPGGAGGWVDQCCHRQWCVCRPDAFAFCRVCGLSAKPAGRAMT
ncbi:TetR/AcrR family transcriptional regulator [Rhodanobacter sp. 115]|uniref:TetR/AcrR family transcriptional regulator n=1 Tax=Rhodanobacter sp. FW021-MT20 TaxID=1162282 RepID=UPI000260D6E5|nr:TetR/AcrR family transcriptional regulator [Rhodanobacter sp. 115]EIL95595.1 transcriptional regulator [Rhodanobacter sp. 115]